MDLLFAENPRPVSRGLEIHPVFIGIDSLYLIIEYPDDDVYRYWSNGIDDWDRRLHDGIPRGDMLIRRGALGYKLSVWKGDARLFITDRVDDLLVNTPHEGQGMGLMLQVGAKWLQCVDFTSQHTLSESVFNLLYEFHVDDPELYPIRINRLDVALDVLGLLVSDFSVDEWRGGWIGRASGKHFYDDNLTGDLSGLAIGSSQGAVRFKVYDKVLEATRTHDLLFWLSVWQAINYPLETECADVARFEWSFKPYSAKFIGMRYLNEYTFSGLKELLNYVTLKWGRLGVPCEDRNKSRWETHPLWLEIRRILIEEWGTDRVGIAKRDYHMEPDINEAYLNAATGWVGGLMARIAIAQGKDYPVDVLDALHIAQSETKPIRQKAQERFEILSRLVAKVSDHE